jgi:hypothetical protein
MSEDNPQWRTQMAAERQNRMAEDIAVILTRMNTMEATQHELRETFTQRHDDVQAKFVEIERHLVIARWIWKALGFAVAIILFSLGKISFNEIGQLKEWIS